MKKKDDSFWSDIKALDERLKRDPDSFCFARLSEIYLKVGLVADALHTARTGVAKHPGYLAGQRALALASNAGGLHDECRVILEQVTAAMPEDVEAQKILAGLYVAAGDLASAIRTYRTVLDFSPDDVASSVELEALQHGSTACAPVSAPPGLVDTVSGASAAESGDDEIIELSEMDILEEPAEEVSEAVPTPEAGGGTIALHDPLSTLTLAELYEQQGYLVKAREIYQTILAEDPTNTRVLAKIARLEGFEPVPEQLPELEETAGFDEEPEVFEPAASEAVPAELESRLFEPLPESSVAVAEPVISVTEPYDVEPAPLESRLFEPLTDSSVAVVETEFSSLETYDVASTPMDSEAFAPLAHRAADNVVETLDVWLENIRRIKACR